MLRTESVSRDRRATPRRRPAGQCRTNAPTLRMLPSRSSDLAETPRKIPALGIRRRFGERGAVRVGGFVIACETPQQVGARRDEQVVTAQNFGSLERVDET